MKTKLLIFGLLIANLISFGQDTLVLKNNTKYPCWIIDEDFETLTVYKLNDNKEKKVYKKEYFKKIIRDEAPKGSNLIIYISDSLSDFQLFKKIAMHLKHYGMTFSNIDKDFLLLETKMKKIKKEYNVKLDISVEGNKIYVRAYGIGDMKGMGLMMNGSGGSISKRDDASFRGEKKGMKTSFSYFSFVYAEHLMKDFLIKNGGKLIYETEKY